MTDRAEAARESMASTVKTLQQNFAGASVDTVAAIAKHWALFQKIGDVPDEDTAGAHEAIQAEVDAKCELLRSLAFVSPADVRMVGRYLAEFAKVDDWWNDDETPIALTDGMRRAIGAAGNPEHPWIRARRLAWELADTLAQADKSQMAIVTPAHDGKPGTVLFGNLDVFGVEARQASR